MFEKLLEDTLLKIGLVGIPLALVVWIAWNAVKNGNKQSDFIMGVWLEKISDTHKEVIDGNQRAEENQTFNLLLMTNIEDRLGSIEESPLQLRPSDVVNRPELQEGINALEKAQQRRNSNSEKLVEQISKIGQERREELKRRMELK